jgi:ABC-type transporter Mla subunit MlaD
MTDKESGNASLRSSLKLIRENLDLAAEHQASAADESLDVDTRLVHHAQSQHHVVTAMANYGPLLDKVAAGISDLEAAQDRFEEQAKRLMDLDRHIQAKADEVEGFVRSVEGTNVQFHRMFQQLTDTLKEVGEFKTQVQPLIDERAAKVAGHV